MGKLLAFVYSHTVYFTAVASLASLTILTLEFLPAVRLLLILIDPKPKLSSSRKVNVTKTLRRVTAVNLYESQRIVKVCKLLRKEDKYLYSRSVGKIGVFMVVVD